MFTFWFRTARPLSSRRPSTRPRPPIRLRVEGLEDRIVPTANDLFADAIVLSGLTAAVTGSNVGFTGEPGEPNHAGNSSPLNSAWYAWTAPLTGTVYLDTQGSQFLFDTTLAVYTESAVNALTEVASNDNASEFNLFSALGFHVTAGTTYHIAVAGAGGSTGTHRLNLKAFPTPVNDDFANAINLSTPNPVPAIAVAGTTTGATGQAGEPDNAGVSTIVGPNKSVWYSWTAPSSGRVALSMAEPTFLYNTTLGVYTGSAVDALTEVVANDDIAGRAAEQSYVEFDAVAGTTYRISVAGFAGRYGNFHLALLNSAAPGVSQIDGRLYVVGSAGDDRVGVQPGAGGSLIVSGTLGGQAFSLAVSGSEFIQTAVFGGNDTVSVAAAVPTPVLVSAGAGDDRITTGGGNGVVIGGAGNDRITTGEGDDVVADDGGANTIDTGDGNDRVRTGAGDDRITTGAGNDGVNGGAGNNTIDTGDGNDGVATGAGDDRITAGAGNDGVNDEGGSNTIDTGDGDDQVQAGFGDDRISTGSGDDGLFDFGGSNTIDTGDGSDYVQTGSEDDRITTGSGDDFVFDDGGSNTIDTGDGDDLVQAGSGDDRITSGDGNDFVEDLGGNNIIRTGAGNDEAAMGVDLLIGNPSTGTDWVDMGSGDDIVYGLSNGLTVVEAGAGNDEVFIGQFGSIGRGVVDGGAGNDTVIGGDADDSFDGGAGDDYLDGGAGYDTLTGGAGSDLLLGGAGNDLLLGGAGTDLLAGGLGADQLFGGSGNDMLFDGDVAVTDEADSLRAVLTDWNPTDPTSYAATRSRLTVTPDTASVDQLFGGAGIDWFWSVDLSDSLDQILGEVRN